jgi:hypothetical protein
MTWQWNIGVITQQTFLVFCSVPREDGRLTHFIVPLLWQ